MFFWKAKFSLIYGIINFNKEVITMPNKRRSRAEMKRVYMMRRLIALLILVLLVTIIITRCSKKKTNDKETETGSNVQIENQTVGENQVVGNVADPALESGPGLNQSQEDDLNKRLLDEEEKLQKDYETYAVVSLDKDNKAYSFSLKEDYKNLVLDRESEEVKEDFNQFWENFKYKLKESSLSLTEFLEPGIELQILDPSDNTTVILLISDGAEIFDRTGE